MSGTIRVAASSLRIASVGLGLRLESGGVELGKQFGARRIVVRGEVGEDLVAHRPENLGLVELLHRELGADDVARHRQREQRFGCFRRIGPRLSARPRTDRARPRVPLSAPSELRECASSRRFALGWGACREEPEGLPRGSCRRRPDLPRPGAGRELEQASSPATSFVGNVRIRFSISFGCCALRQRSIAARTRLASSWATVARADAIRSRRSASSAKSLRDPVKLGTRLGIPLGLDQKPGDSNALVLIGLLDFGEN